MTVIFLPGFSGQYNQPEMQEIATHLEAAGLSVQKVEWPHWANPQHQFDPEAEAEKVWQTISLLTDKEVSFVGKSIGTVVCVKLLAKHPELGPRRVVLLGVPPGSISAADKEQFAATLSGLGNKVTIYQNELDPFGPAAEIQEWLGQTGAEIKIVQANATHAYNHAKDGVLQSLHS